MRLRHMKFTIVMVGVAVWLPILLLASLLISWPSPNRANAGEHKETSRIHQAEGQGGSNTTSIQGQTSHTDQVPTVDIKPTAVRVAPLGTEDGLEELKQRMEGQGNAPIPRGTHQQADSSQ